MPASALPLQFGRARFVLGDHIPLQLIVSDTASRSPVVIHFTSPAPLLAWASSSYFAMLSFTRNTLFLSIICS